MKNLKNYCVLLLIIVIISSCISAPKQSETPQQRGYIRSSPKPGVSTEVSHETKKWTIMFYDDADFLYDEENFTSAYNPIDFFAATAFSCKNIHVVALEDPYGNESAKTWYIIEKKVLLKENGEINMGDPKTLKDFISYCKKEFPAERYILLVYDHGMGWEGCCIDTPSKDKLTMPEMKDALSKSGVDILCFTGTCLMGAVESVYELRDCIDIYISSEEYSFYLYYWAEAINPICRILNENPDLSNEEIGKKIIEIIEENNKNLDYKEYITMSAIKTEKLDTLVENVNTFTEILLSNQNWDEIIDTCLESQSFGSSGMIKNLVDLYDLADRCSNIEGLEEVSRKVKELLKNTVIAEIHGKKHPNAWGISVYLGLYYGKEEAEDNLSDYEKSGLDFVCDTEWSSFLHELHSGYYEKLFGGLTKNLLSNSSFEEGENKPYGWAYTSREGVSFLWNEKNVYNGKYCISITNNDENNPYPNIWMQTLKIEKISKKLKLTAHIKSKNLKALNKDAKAAIYILFFDGDDNVIGFFTTPQDVIFYGTRDWTEVVALGEVPEGAAKIEIMAFMIGTGTAFFDDIKLYGSEKDKVMITTE